MTFYHLWVHIDDYNQNYNEKTILDFGEPKGSILGLKLEVIFNGTEFITATANTNHFSSAVKACISFFEQLPEYLNYHSYGVLYVWNDEDKEMYNEFKVWRLKNGKVENCKDTVLSPIELED